MTKRCTKWLAIAFCSLLMVPDASHGDVDPLSVAEARLACLQNIKATFSSVIVHNPDPELARAVYARIERPLPQDLDRTETYDCEFRFARGSALWQRDASKSMIDGARAANAALEKSTRLMIGQGRVEVLSWPYQSKVPVGQIDTSRAFPNESAIDIGLGIRLIGAQEWLSPEKLREAKKTKISDDDLEVEVKDTHGFLHLLRFGRAAGYALIHYHVTNSIPGSSSFEDIECTDLRVVSGIILPFKIHRQSTYTDSGGRVRHPITTTLTVKEYIVGDLKNTPESLHIRWPKGADIWEARARSAIVATTDAQVMTDDLIAEQIKQQDDEKGSLLRRTREKLQSATSRPAMDESATKAGAPSRPE